MSQQLIQIRSTVSAKAPQFDLSALRAKLADAKGPRFWRSLRELAETPDFQKVVEDEFPHREFDWRDPQSRRDILRLMGGMLAMAGLTACTKQPQEKILPYVRQPEEHLLGRPLFYATAMPFRGEAIGLLVESHEGRPTKVEGNPDHPGSLGRTNVWSQASTLDLYDPDRSQSVLFRGRPSSWSRFLGIMADVRKANAAGLHVLSGPMSSPTLQAQKAALLASQPGMQWHEYEAVSNDNALEGARLAFGTPVNPVYRFDQADVVLSLDADFLLTMPACIANARAFISRRHGQSERERMNRLYVAEPTPTITGAKADNRLAIKASDVEGVARAIAAQIGVGGGSAPTLSGPAGQWAAVVAKDLQAHRGTSLVLAGEQQSPATQALAHAMNQALGNAGKTVVYTDPLQPNPTAHLQSLKALVAAMNAGQVQTLMILGCNPVYSAPADLQFQQALDKVPLRLHHGRYLDETATRCHWHIPATHYLEEWSDARAYDGTISIIQPLIAPLYDGKTAHEMLSTLTDAPDQTPYQIVKGYWQQQRPSANFEDFWEKVVHDGVIPDTALPAKTVSARAEAPPSSQAAAGQGMEIIFRPDPCIWDGEFSNNAWLQETPKPLTKLTWDNAAYISPTTAERLQLDPEDMVELSFQGRKVNAPVWIVPGQANDCVTVSLGYGRTRAGKVGDRMGFNANFLRTSTQPDFGQGLEVRKVDGKWHLACTQDHHSMEGRDVVRSGRNEDFLKNEELFLNEENVEKEKDQVTLSLYPEWQYSDYRWGMVIDQNACIGCNACVVACVVENNIPVVGKTQVQNGREMHWLRIDRYYEGSLSNPAMHFQPVLCMHCETAPCEPVCPVAATVHSGEGINQMVYNRCVGTRYCSNNCPYKVRRFNFLLYQDWETPSLEPLRNPDVTVRSRGVMEKCTYCIQRIQGAKIEAEKEDRRVRDGDVVTACQSACPTDAIVFGDINDQGGRVYKMKQSPLNYSLLAELSTQPRTTYLAKLTNPNPEMGRNA